MEHPQRYLELWWFDTRDQDKDTKLANFIMQHVMIWYIRSWLGKNIVQFHYATCHDLICTGPGKKTVPRLREFCSCCCLPLLPGIAWKILATWEAFFCRALYVPAKFSGNLREARVQEPPPRNEQKRGQGCRASKVSWWQGQQRRPIRDKRHVYLLILQLKLDFEFETKKRANALS